MALGYANASANHGGMEYPYVVDPAVNGFAYDVAVHANNLIPGIAIALSGVVGPPKVAYTATTVTLELGWFGR